MSHVTYRHHTHTLNQKEERQNVTTYQINSPIKNVPKLKTKNTTQYRPTLGVLGP